MPVTSYGFNSALVDGGFGLLTLEGTAAFDDLGVRTNDAQFQDSVLQTLRAASATSDGGTASTRILSQTTLDPIVDAAIARWAQTGLLDTAAMARLDAASFVVAELVITSYSIHYTKLYDGGHAQPGAARFGTERVHGHQQLECGGTDRITSYNVCYTKLLRN